MTGPLLVLDLFRSSSSKLRCLAHKLRRSSCKSAHCERIFQRRATTLLPSWSERSLEDLCTFRLLPQAPLPAPDTQLLASACGLLRSPSASFEAHMRVRSYP